jgi:predicted permease
MDGILPDSLSDLAHTTVDARVLVFAVLATVGAALLVGVVPAMRSTAQVPGATLRGGAPGEGSGHRRGLRDLLVACETTLSVVLLVGAALMVRSMIQLQRADVGFRPEGLLTMKVSLPSARYTTWTSRQQLSDDVLSHVRAQPGVDTAATAMDAPPSFGVTGYNDVQVEGEEPITSGLNTVAMNVVSPGYFAVVGTRILEGRTFTEAETRNGELVTVLGRGLAERLSPGRSMVGRRLRRSQEGPWVTVVGVAENVVAGGSMSSSMRHYQSYTPEYHGVDARGNYLPSPVTVIVRAGGDASAIAPALRRVVREIDSDLPAPEITLAETRISAMLALPRFNTLALTLFAALACVLAAVGLFGVLSYAVARRTREIGVRVALGARDGDVRALVVWQGMLPALAGVIAGCIIALFATRVLASLLYGVTPRDVPAFVGAVLVLTVTALAACYIPARRATRIDPMTALRAE